MRNLYPSGKSVIGLRASHPSEGRIMIVTKRCGEMRWTQRLRQTSAAEADGEVVWSRHPDAGVRSAEQSADDGG